MNGSQARGGSAACSQITLCNLIKLFIMDCTANDGDIKLFIVHVLVFPVRFPVILIFLSTLPAELRQRDSLKQFKRHLKTQFFGYFRTAALCDFCQVAPFRALTY